jgi:hypothetical protein
LAKWDFIPSFATRKFTFNPSSANNGNRRNIDTAGTNVKNPGIQFVNGDSLAIPQHKKVVILAHGFLGSRFDLSHIAEDLARQGFVCVAPEYPESLEASYPRLEGLDRKVINDRLIRYVQDNIQPTSWAAIGHSMGCRSVMDIGDETWARVLMGAGRAPELPGGSTSDLDNPFPLRKVGGRLLFISSVNDGAVKWGGGIRIPSEYTILQESQLPKTSEGVTFVGGGRAAMMLPDRAALVFDRENAPNHISFLSDNVNEAMISFLAPLLPVARAFEIPVLDFDKYVISRDSEQTAEILKPLISSFLLAGDDGSSTSTSQATD